ncbi:MAG: hypothetical protein WA419_12660 [Silvibacterium sp.]
MSNWFQGGFAGGGDFVANRPMLVGENGPEILNPSTAGTIIPNHALGGDIHHVYVDASNSHDPAATEQAVHRAMRQYMPQIVTHSVRGMRESQKRRPLCRR